MFIVTRYLTTNIECIRACKQFLDISYWTFFDIQLMIDKLILYYGLMFFFTHKHNFKNIYT